MLVALRIVGRVWGRRPHRDRPRVGTVAIVGTLSGTVKLI
jgi:hypothetical protein